MSAKTRVFSVTVMLFVIGLVTLFTGPALFAGITIYALMILGIILILDDLEKIQFTPIYNYAHRLTAGLKTDKSDKSDKPGQTPAN